MKEISVAYTKDDEFWPFSNGENFHLIESVGDLLYKEGHTKLIDNITYVCFVSGKGIYFELFDLKTSMNDPRKSWTKFNKCLCPKPTPEILEYLCEMKLFSRTANAKMWYSAFRYAVENKECVEFWNKYKDTMGGIRFMSLMLGSKEDLDAN